MLWDQLKEWKENCRWVELSHPLSPRTPHWSGFPDMADTTLFDYPRRVLCEQFELVSQYGTHVDAPAHFIEGAPTLESFAAETARDAAVRGGPLRQSARKPGLPPPPSRTFWTGKRSTAPFPRALLWRSGTDWSKRGDLDNMDESGQKHYPGWSIECLEYL